MNLPNKITTARLFLAFVFMFFLWAGFPFGKVMAWAIFILAALSDLYDGSLARRGGNVTDYGKLMDPVADKVLICSAFVSFVQLRETHVPAWMVLIIISREFAITGLRVLALSKGQVIAAGRWGKHKTVSQVASIVIILSALAVRDIGAFMGWEIRFYEFSGVYFQNFVYALMSVTVGLTVLSGIYYLYENRTLFWEERH